MMLWLHILYKIQWNPDITIRQGSSKIISLYRGIVISKLPIQRYGRKITDPWDPIFSSLEYVYAYSNGEKIGSQGSSTVITLYFETCYVASMVSPSGVVVIRP